jgi:hypothetical protein
MPEWTDEQWAETVTDYVEMNLDGIQREMDQLRQERDYLRAALQSTSDMAQSIGVPTAQVSPQWKKMFRETVRQADAAAKDAHRRGDKEAFRTALAVRDTARRHLEGERAVPAPQPITVAKVPEDDVPPIVVGYPCPVDVVLDQGMNRCPVYGPQLDNLACSRPQGHDGDHIATAGALPGAEVLAIASSEE